ncbi:MAG: OB-fold domain-containing protein [Dehalococcoidia bacterium]
MTPAVAYRCCRMSLIDFVRGQVVERGADAAVLAVGGFGLRLLGPATTHRQGTGRGDAVSTPTSTCGKR